MAAPRLPMPLLGIALLHYAFMLGASGELFVPTVHGMTFNSMALNLLEGRFDVDPATIGDEAFERDGRSYAYFGIFLALWGWALAVWFLALVVPALDPARPPSGRRLSMLAVLAGCEVLTRPTMGIALLVALALQVAAAHAFAVIYGVSPLGPSLWIAPQGLLAAYRDFLSW